MECGGSDALDLEANCIYSWTHDVSGRLRRLMRDPMPSRPIPDNSCHVPVPIRRGGIRRQILLGFIAFAVLLVQVSHPALHPYEVIDPGADVRHTCPFSHTTAAFLITLPLLLCGELPLERLRDPLLWLEGHGHFIHSLAPRPPPTQLS